MQQHDSIWNGGSLVGMDRPKVPHHLVSGVSQKTGRVMQVQEAFKREVKASGEDHAIRWRLFGVERFLDRFQQTIGTGRLVVKGGVLLRTLLPAHLRRATKDIDLAAVQPIPIADLATAATAACSLDLSDGCTFDPASVRVAPMVNGRASGARVTARGRCGASVLEAQADIGFGDVWSPGAQRVVMPSMCGVLPGIQIDAYHPATIVAEKYHAMVDKGLENSRMKDFFDIAMIADHLDISGQDLTLALRDTFANRGMPIPTERPVCFTDAFIHGDNQKVQWQAFQRRNPAAAPLTLAACAQRAWSYVYVPSVLAATQQPNPCAWNRAVGQWQP